MGNLMKTEDREIKKKVPEKKESKRILEYRERISDDDYLDHAIRKIAIDLSHYLTK
ncbi:MAG TPA: hypothetical protein PK573_06190 [Spirochaetota bacterium]|nr:hypothetical protein [Spirochaetota bacterium]HRZ25712.1 hypothetical protein [Spirochaetota bacterium]HSA14809.1 hypothetical protein [Spirochaetota bacterium]